MREGTAWICIRPFFQQKNTIPEFFKTVRLANTFPDIKVCLNLEQERVKASWKREERKLHLQEMMAHLEQMASGIREGAGVDVHQV